MCAKIVNINNKVKDIAYGALKVFAEQGFDQTSMNDIAHGVGIAKGTLYDYFSSKAELIETVVNLGLEECNSSVKNFPELKFTDPVKRIKATVNRIVDTWMNDKNTENFYRAIFQMLLSKQTSSQQKKRIINNFLKSLTFFEEAINEGAENGLFIKSAKQNAAQITINFITFFDGLYLYYMANKQAFNFRKQINLYLDILLKSLKA